MVEFAILSTGRAGSRYIAKVLTDCGIPTGHEQCLHPARDNCHYKGDSSWTAVAYMDDFNGPAFHQVRHPLRVISSLLNGWVADTLESPYNHYTWSINHGIDPCEGDLLRWAIKFVYEWNERCSHHAEMRWCVESLDADKLVEIGNALGENIMPGLAATVLKVVPTNTNKHAPGPKLDWSDLPSSPDTDRLVGQAQEYGYV